MNLNAKSNNFIFRFPKNFFPKHLKDKYELYLASSKNPYKDFTEFINSTIQGISFPKIDVETTTEQDGDITAPRVYQGGQTAIRHLDRTFTVQFKHIEGFVNYFAFLEFLLWVHSEDNTNVFLEDLPVKILNNENQEILNIIMSQNVLKTSPESLKFNYSDVKNTPKSFSITFLWNGFEVDFDFDKIANKIKENSL